MYLPICLQGHFRLGCKRKHLGKGCRALGRSMGRSWDMRRRARYQANWGRDSSCSLCSSLLLLFVLLLLLLLLPLLFLLLPLLLLLLMLANLGHWDGHGHGH